MKKFCAKDDLLLCVGGYIEVAIYSSVELNVFSTNEANHYRDFLCKDATDLLIEQKQIEHDCVSFQLFCEVETIPKRRQLSFAIKRKMFSPLRICFIAKDTIWIVRTAMTERMSRHWVSFVVGEKEIPFHN